MKSKIKLLANQQGFQNIQQFAIAAGLPWSMAKSIWCGDIGNKSLKTLVKATRALKCKIEDLYVSDEEEV